MNFPSLSRFFLPILLLAGMMTAGAKAQIVTAGSLAYSLTATTEPVAPGQIIDFLVTASNTGSTGQSFRLDYTVPDSTVSENGYGAGTRLVAFSGYLNAGESRSTLLRLSVVSGSQAPLDGSNVTLTLRDFDRVASIARTFTVRYAPALRLQLATSQARIIPGQPFTYTLAYNNAGTGTATNATLRVPLPAGTTFVSADGGGAVGGDGMVQWFLGTIPAGGHGQLHLTLSSSSPASVTPLVPLEATLNDGSGNLTRAGDVKAVTPTSQLLYSLTATTEPVAPGQIIDFLVTASNTGSTGQSFRLDYTVPDSTVSENGYGAGTRLVAFSGYLNAGESRSTLLRLSVVSGSQAPLDGSNVTLTLRDFDRVASIGAILNVATPPPRITSATSATGKVGSPFTYQIAAVNSPTSFTATGLPPGLSLNGTTGLIAGTPTAQGAYPVGLSVVRGTNTGTATLTINIQSSRTLPLVSVVGAPEFGGFLVSRVDGRSDVNVIIPFHNGGSAIQGGDYERFPATVTIPAGQLEAVIPITLLPGANRAKKVKVFLDPSPTRAYDISKAQSKVFLSDLP